MTLYKRKQQKEADRSEIYKQLKDAKKMMSNPLIRNISLSRERYL